MSPNFKEKKWKKGHSTFPFERLAVGRYEIKMVD